MRGAYYDRAAEPGPLQIGRVNLRDDRRSQFALLHIDGDADDLQCDALAHVGDREAFAERVFAREIPSRQGFVDDRHRRRAQVVAIIEFAPGHHPRPQRAEIVRADSLIQRVGVRRQRASFDIEAEMQNGEDPRAGHHRRFDARSLRDLIEDLLDEARALLIGAFNWKFAARLEAHRKEVARVETEFRATHPRKAVDEQPGAYEQHHRQRDLGHHQRAPQSLASQSIGAAASLLQLVVHRQIRRLPRRDEAEEDAGQQRYQQCERKNGLIDASGPQLILKLLVSVVTLRQQARQSLQPPLSQQQTGGSAQRGEEQALYQQLSQQSPAVRAERQANRHLFAPRAGARQQQIGDVCAADEQHAADRAEQDEQRLSNPAQPPFEGRRDVYGDVFV